MIRATVISLVDQGLLSALNFLLALVLIRFASQEEYGLYTQILGLQSLFSVVHAGLFVSAYMSILPRLSGRDRLTFQAAMARSEMMVTVISGLAVFAVTWLVARWMNHDLTWTTSIAAALALLGLWWREFARARYFVDSHAWKVLRLDTLYALLLLVAVASLCWSRTVSATAVLWCIGVTGAVSAAIPLWGQAGLVSVDAAAVRASLGNSWQAARWETLTSLVTWAHAQTFVYFAALQGGLTAAAEISAARLLTMPLALVWLSFANILRPAASRMLANGEPRSQLDRLAMQSALFVLGLASIYGLLLMVSLPLIERYLFAAAFVHLGPMILLWVLYFALTGMTTIATSLLRSACEFKALFRMHTACSIIAIAAFTAGLSLHTPTVFVAVLVLVEALLAGWGWRLLRVRLRKPGEHIPLGGEQKV